MITEDYVSFETAKLLKEKGFDEDCSRFYMPNGHGRWKYEHYHDFDKKDRIECPTLQIAMKWLRIVHSQIIVPNIRVEDPISGIINCYIVGIWYIPKNNGGAFCYTTPAPYNVYSSFEEACEEGIKWCLENLV